MPGALTSNEEAQLSQTIEMFEVITQSQPMDYQSLEILKEAYLKVGRQEEVIATSKRIAEAYVQLGQLSSAILEYESILQSQPDDPDVRHALTQIESKANNFSAPIPPSEGNRLARHGTSELGARSGDLNDAELLHPAEIDDGKAAMQKLFVETKCITAQEFELFWPKPNLREAVRQPKEPFIHTLSERGIQGIERSLKLLCEKARLPYLPIEKYDVDVEFARTFSKETCMRWCVLPFDRMSKSVLVATANPFNKQVEREIQAHSKTHVIWYMTQPGELVKVLKKIFR